MDGSSSFENPYGKQEPFAPYGHEYRANEPAPRKLGETIMTILFFLLTGVIVASLIWISFDYSKTNDNSDLRSNHKLIDDIDLAIYEYRKSHDQWPPNLDRLEKHRFSVFYSRVGKAPEKITYVDSWGRPLQLLFDASGKTAPWVRSAGPDEKFKTMDDIERQSAW